ncbi:glycosyltransferase [uncultured Sphingopyxis sp.]|uniref:glycosyltransferase n=1 Tax=uncultured Sphingopyxis sp. TaxID=310581 RepID=UPI000B0A63D5|nr:glycosyltransferase [uncultured Sphingopyxis sp.]
MKILFLVSSMLGGGAERVAALLANAWSARGYNVTLMPTFSARGECVYPLSESVHLDFLSDHCPPAAGRLTRLRMLRRLIRSFHPDVIVSFLPHVNCTAVIAAAGFGIPVVACERTYPPLLKPPLPLMYRIGRRITYPLASALVGQTETTARWLRRFSGQALVTVIANPVVNPLPSQAPFKRPDDFVPPGRKLILWAGRIDESKRAELLVKTVARPGLIGPDWHVALVGDGPLRPAIKALIDSEGLSDRVTLAGFAGNLGDWYQRADLYVMTTSFEGFPNTLLEALSHGVPSIAFDVLTGPAELSKGGTRLVLLPDENHVEMLADALESLTADAGRRDELRHAALKTNEDYSEQAVLAQWDGLFAKIVKPGGARDPEGQLANGERA